VLYCENLDVVQNFFIFSASKLNFTSAMAPKKVGSSDRSISGRVQYYQWSIFATLFIGYATYAYNRKSVSLAMPELIKSGLQKSDAGMSLNLMIIFLFSIFLLLDICGKLYLILFAFKLFMHSLNFYLWKSLWN